MAWSGIIEWAIPKGYCQAICSVLYNSGLGGFPSFVSAGWLTGIGSVTAILYIYRTMKITFTFP